MPRFRRYPGGHRRFGVLSISSGDFKASISLGDGVRLMIEDEDDLRDGVFCFFGPYFFLQSMVFPTRTYPFGQRFLVAR